MTNETFKLLTEDEKQTKFRAVLNAKTNGCLTEEEMRDILLTASLNKQYSIIICQDSEVFTSRLTLADSWNGRTVFGQALLGRADCPGQLFRVDEAAAVMLCDTADTDGTRMLYIYIPENRFQKGTVNHE